MFAEQAPTSGLACCPEELSTRPRSMPGWRVQAMPQTAGEFIEIISGFATAVRVYVDGFG